MQGIKNKNWALWQPKKKENLEGKVIKEFRGKQREQAGGMGQQRANEDLRNSPESYNKKETAYYAVCLI